MLPDGYRGEPAQDGDATPEEAPRRRVYLAGGERVGRDGARAETWSARRAAKRKLHATSLALSDELRERDEYQRPRTRGDCLPGGCNEARPCPWVSCVHHLYVDVSDRTGSIKYNSPDLEVWELPETCALDAADRGGMTLEEVGEMMNLTRERVRQVEQHGIARLALMGHAMYKLRDLLEQEPSHHDYAARDTEMHGESTTGARDAVAALVELMHGGGV